MDKELRVRTVEPGEEAIWVEYLVRDSKWGFFVSHALVGEGCKIHEKLFHSSWFLHNYKGPAVTGQGKELYAIDGYEMTKEEWLLKTSLGKILYG
jgi:hypothetical protein